MEWLLTFAVGQIKVKRASDDLMRAWLQVLKSVLPRVSKEQIRQQVLPLALQRQSHKGSPIQARAVCGVLLCYCAQALPEATEVLHRALAACQDLEAPVRLCMAAQLPQLAAAVSSDKAAFAEVLTEVQAYKLHLQFVFSSEVNSMQVTAGVASGLGIGQR